MAHTFFIFRPDPLELNKQTFEAQYPSLASEAEVISSYMESEDGLLAFGSARFLSESAELIEASCEPIYQSLLAQGKATPDAERGWEEDGEGRSYRVNGDLWLYYGTTMPSWWEPKSQPLV